MSPSSSCGSAAAAAAKAAFATETAIGWYERLLALTAPEQAGELLIELGDHLLLAARWGDAGKVYNRALEVAELTGDRRCALRRTGALAACSASPSWTGRR